ncbi:hypothetical protein NBRC116592_30350 [Colwellia sp. KU-HH00111]|uniref:hypothetical protein n=1 Tax=Colwellia sp. KU-HH00111 TaxID=3127652 RepID=UPI003105C5CB
MEHIINKDIEMLKVRTVHVLCLLMPILLFICITNLSGCRQAPPVPKEGDVVIWKHSSELIVKAKLGQRRAHVITHPSTDHRFYEPEYERFIGQFPIDYDPKPFPKFTEQERIAFEKEYASKIHAVKSIHLIEFNLILNGVEAKATDVSHFGGNRKMDDANQVKVILGGHGSFPVIMKSGAKRAPYNTQQFFERELMKELDISSKKTKYGLDCYRFIDNRGGKRCFGQSANTAVSGFSFYDSHIFKNNILVTSQEFIYGGIKVQWFTDPKNINRAREIDAAIWRLLDAWNISPNQNSN